MSNDNNFNDILRSKFSEKEHPFDEANWKSMRTMIDNSRAKKKRTLFIIGSLALLLCAIGTGAIYEWKSNSGKSENSIITVTSNSASKSAKSTTSSTTNSTTRSINPSPVISTNTSVATVTNSTPVAANNNTNTATVAVANSSSQKGDKAKKHHTKSDAQRIAAEQKMLADVVQDTKVDNVVSMKESSDAPLTQAQLPVNSTPPIVPKTPPPPAAKVNTKAPDTTSSLPERFSDEPRIYNGKKQMISIDAGTSYSFGWSPALNIKQGGGWNYVVGVGYAHYLGKKYFLKTGIQFSNFGHMSSYTYNYQHSSAQNPNLINDSVITTKRLYYLSIPVQFEKFIGHKSSIGLGGSISYLLTSTASATTYQQLDNNPPVNYQNYSQNVHLKGYNTWTASAYLLYRYTFNRHFSAYFMIDIMTPVESKTFFGQNLYFSDKSAKFLLSYTL